MFTPLEVYIGLRYTRAKRRNHFISLTSTISVLGVALGVTALITVLSVMNGFEKELKSRILAMTAHATVVEPGGLLKNWPEVVEHLSRQPHVEGLAPFIRREAMFTHAGAVTGGLVRGIVPSAESAVSEVGEKMQRGELSTLVAGSFNVVIGNELAQTLRADVGDKLTLIAPQPTMTPAGILPRLKRFTISGIFSVGMHEYDSALAIVHIDDAARLFRMQEQVSGVRLRLDEPFAADRITRELVDSLGTLPGYYGAFDWTRYHENFFTALKTEKRVMFVILALIVCVGVFNIVSTLVMVVTDKQSEVAILRTIGMTPGDILRIFIVQGTLIGLVGTLLGVTGGVWLASSVETLVPAIEGMLGIDFMPSSIYYIPDLPSDMRWADVARIGTVAFLLCVLATLYPAYKASRTQPVDALRYE